MKTGVGVNFEKMYRVESHESTDAKAFRRQKLKIYFFFVIDVVVFSVCLGSLIEMYEDWNHNCERNFNGWAICILIFSFCSILLNFFQWHTINRN